LKERYLCWIGLKVNEMSALAETADRQSLWSSTAGVLKRRVEIARWVTFAFSILGALLAAIASQLNDAPRMYFATAGAVLLAIVSFVKSRLLGGLQVTNWLRARTASEALKREAYKYAASVTPYDDPLKRDGALSSERERIEHDVDDLLAWAVASAKAGSAPRGKLSRDEYVAGRVCEQIERFYLPRADANKKISINLRWTEFSLALAATIITAMVGVAGKELFGIKFDFVALTAVLTTIAGAVLAHIEATRCDFLVMIYRATARRLGAERANVGDVNALSAEQWSQFVNRCEAIISDENTSWAAKWTKA
jgi:conflict system pore-forming effector with SLATT domain/uncharacterized protein DUF4231